MAMSYVGLKSEVVVFLKRFHFKDVQNGGPLGGFLSCALPQRLTFKLKKATVKKGRNSGTMDGCAEVVFWFMSLKYGAIGGFLTPLILRIRWWLFFIKDV